MSFQQQPMALLTSPINSSYSYGPSVDSPVSLNAGLINPVTGETLTTVRNTTQQDIDQIRQIQQMQMQILEQQNRDYNVRLVEAKNMIKEQNAQIQGQGAQLQGLSAQVQGLMTQVQGLKQEMYELKKNHDRLRAEYRPKPKPKLNSLIGTRESFAMNLNP